MTIEALLQNIDSKLGVLIGLAQGNSIPADAAQPTIAGAGAEPAVAVQVNAAIAAAGGVVGEISPAPSKPKRGRPALKAENAEPVAPVTPVVTPAPTPAVDPFAVETTEVISSPVRSLNDVRAALVVFQNMNDQPAALKLMKDTTGAETLAQIKPEDYGKLFRAAIPADKFDIGDVRGVLVKANERVANSGLGVLKKFGADNILQLKPEHFTDAIITAHGIK